MQGRAETMIQLTREVAQAVAAMRYEAIPPQAISAACNGITDCAAVTILGRTSEVVRVLRSVLGLRPGRAIIELWKSI